MTIKPEHKDWHCCYFFLHLGKVFAKLCNKLFQWEEKLCQTENMFFKIQTKRWNFFCALRKVIVLTLQFLIFEKLRDQGVWCMTCFFHGTLLKSVNKWSELFRFSLVKEQLWRTVINKKIYGLKIVWYEWNHTC